MMYAPRRYDLELGHTRCMSVLNAMIIGSWISFEDRGLRGSSERLMQPDDSDLARCLPTVGILFEAASVRFYQGEAY